MAFNNSLLLSRLATIHLISVVSTHTAFLGLCAHAVNGLGTRDYYTCDCEEIVECYLSTGFFRASLAKENVAQAPRSHFLLGH